MFSREFFFPSAQEKYDNTGIFLEVLCRRIMLYLVLSQPWPFQHLRIIEEGESDEFYHKTFAKYVRTFCSSLFGSEVNNFNSSQALSLLFFIVLPTYRHIKKILFIFHIKDFVALIRSISQQYIPPCLQKWKGIILPLNANISCIIAKKTVSSFVPQ